MINFKETSMPSQSKDNSGEFENQKLRHICEVCGKQEIRTPEEGYKAGYDYVSILGYKSRKV